MRLSEEDLLKCCGSRRWAKAMAAREFADKDALLRAADEEWSKATREDILEAFSHHPRIGATGAQGWAKGEQSRVADAADATREALARGNAEYEARFGHIYIVCATGKSAEEMLAILQARLRNDPGAELRVAAAEQGKITRIRLEKLLAAT